MIAPFRALQSRNGVRTRQVVCSGHDTNRFSTWNGFGTVHGMDSGQYMEWVWDST